MNDYLWEYTVLLFTDKHLRYPVPNIQDDLDEHQNKYSAYLIPTAFITLVPEGEQFDGYVGRSLPVGSDLPSLPFIELDMPLPEPIKGVEKIGRKKYKITKRWEYEDLVEIIEYECWITRMWWPAVIKESL